MAKIGCVVMASGQSVRFGGNKLIESFLGEPLIVHTLRKLPKELAKIVVVTRNPEVVEIAATLGLTSILHDLPDQSDTIRLGVDSMRDMDGCLFSVADQPFCEQATIRGLMEAFEGRPQAIVRTCFQGKWGNPVLFPSALFSELMKLSAGQTGGAVIKRHPELLMPVEAKSELELMDIDTREQFFKLEATSSMYRRKLD